jgi:hypothetical protein
VQVFIILGSPRSGTTLLATTLSLHSGIHVIDQTDFITPMAFIIDRIKQPVVGKKMIANFIVESNYFSHSIGKWLSADDIESTIEKSAYCMQDMVTNLYQLMAKKIGKQECGDKSVSDIGFHPILNRVGLFDSDIKIIHIVRDVRAVFNSLEKLDWINERHVFPRSWSNANLGLHQLLKDKPNYHFLKYEDLIVAAETTLDSVCSFLGFEYEGNLLSHDSRGREYLGESHHSNLQKPFMAQNVSKWKNDLSKHNKALCDLQARESLEYFDYL